MKHGAMFNFGVFYIEEKENVCIYKKIYTHMYKIIYVYIFVLPKSLKVCLVTFSTESRSSRISSVKTRAKAITLRSRR